MLNNEVEKTIRVISVKVYFCFVKTRTKEMVHILTGYEVPVRFSTHPDRLRSSCQVVYLITNNEQIITNQRQSASKKNHNQSASIFFFCFFSVNIFSNTSKYLSVIIPH